MLGAHKKQPGCVSTSGLFLRCKSDADESASDFFKVTQPELAKETHDLLNNRCPKNSCSFRDINVHAIGLPV